MPTYINKKVIFNEYKWFFKIIEIINLLNKTVTYTLLVDQEVVSKWIQDKNEAIDYMKYIVKIYENQKYNNKYLNFEDWKKENRKENKMEIIKIDNLEINWGILFSEIEKQKENWLLEIINLTKNKVLYKFKFDPFEKRNKDMYKIIFRNRRYLTLSWIPWMDEYENTMEDFSYFTNDLLNFQKSSNKEQSLIFEIENEIWDIIKINCTNKKEIV